MAQRLEKENSDVVSSDREKPFAFAGLWDSWRNIELGDTLETFTINIGVVDGLHFDSCWWTGVWEEAVVGSENAQPLI